MAEFGNQVEPNDGAEATAPLAQGVSTPEPMVLQVPAPGAVLGVTAEADGVYVVDPAARTLGLELAWRGADLVLAFSGAGSIQIHGAAKLAESNAPPRVVLADGTELGVDRLHASLAAAAQGVLLETAAGPETAPDGETPTAGFNGYHDYRGEPAIAGLVGTGTLGAEDLSGPSSFAPLDDPGLDGDSTAGAGTGATSGTATALSGAESGSGGTDGTAGSGTTGGAPRPAPRAAARPRAAPEAAAAARPAPARA